ncbi:hypothetical protein SAMN02745171_01251 [Porphyromonas circumdentaria]|uniref:Uncharacterized protein n=1 Tax=Porphyromonas circumdentaria TaxID=29524 RepID=A0A1T4NW31_9PORP|nr:hypothetical protein [Porphyromonas circumdentaria]SJZ83257.1 hypothetical protein SAMN02745171_01251 [Porphyromonas circumdentaria]
MPFCGYFRLSVAPNVTGSVGHSVEGVYTIVLLLFGEKFSLPRL